MKDIVYNEIDLVSVIMPAYNHEKYIYNAMKSVSNQTYKNIEFIIINDGSIDHTMDIIKRFKNETNNIRVLWLDKENQGVCKTLNTGLGMANGKYVAFIASDDIWKEDKIVKQVKFLKENEFVGMVFSDIIFIKNEKVSNKKWSEYKTCLESIFLKGLPNANIYEQMIINRFIPSSTVLIKKECQKAIGLFDEELIYEDDDFYLRIMKEYPIGYVNEPLAYYRMHDKNFSNNNLKMIKGYFSTIIKQFKKPDNDIKIVRKFYLLINACFAILRDKIKKRSLKFLI